MNKTKLILLLVVLTLTAIVWYADQSSTTTLAPTAITHHRADYIIDGDTFVTTSGKRIRLIGIDTPEHGECFYDEATTFLSTQISGQPLLLTRDVSDTDRYERALRYVYIDADRDGVGDIFVNDLLVSQGYARTLEINPDKKHRKTLARSQNQAKQNDLGLWAACN